MFKSMKKFISNKKKIFIISMLMLFTFGVSGTLSYIIDETDWITNIFKSGLHAEGDLIIKKDVEHPFGSNYMIPEDLSFDFVIDFGSEYEGSSVIVNGVEVEISDNKVLVNVQPNSQVRIEDILAGTNVVVSETLKEGFTEKENKESQEVVISKNEVNTLTFTNIYSPSKVYPVNIDLKVEKKLEGDREWVESDKFTFSLEVQKDDLTWERLSTKDVTFDSRVVNFNDVIHEFVFDSMKVYSFRIVELKEVNNGIIYDQIKYFDVNVTDKDMDGSYEIDSVVSTSTNTSISLEDNKFLVDIVITNIYELDGEVEVLIEISKEIENLSGGDVNKSGFIFVLYDESGNEVLRSNETSQAGETFIKLTYTPENVNNTYSYVLKELNAGEVIGPLTYDSNEYVINISVVDKLDGTIEAISENELKYTFKNTYKALESEPVILNGTKELLGRDINDNEFEFELYEADSNYKVLNDTPIQTIKNNKNTFNFNGIIFDKVNTHYYVIKEKETKLNGITYDKKNYFVKVEVNDIEGKLNTKVITTDQYFNEKEVVFTNTYDPTDATVKLSGIKELKNLNLEKDMFFFDLYKSDENYQIIGKVDSVRNNENGEFTFKTLTFDQEGTYYYVIKEDSSKPINGVTYDEKEIQVKIEVKDDKNGKLISTITSNEIKFTNTYSPKDTNIVIAGNKVLNGYSLENNMFTFELYEDDQLIQETMNKEDGTFAFNSITYKKEGTHTYYVKEKQISSKYQELITFDTSIYKVVVNVKDNNGQLVITQKITKEDKEVKEIIFTNTYTPIIETITIPIDINKTIKFTGEDTISPEGFKFVLKKNDVNVSEVTSNADGKATIELTFTKDDFGIHVYKLSEINDKRKNIKYSTDVYEIAINIELDEKDSLVITQSVDNKVVDSIKCSFVNTYYKGSVDTSDNTHILLYVLVSIISAFVLLILLIFDKKNKHDSK